VPSALSIFHALWGVFVSTVLVALTLVAVIPLYAG